MSETTNDKVLSILNNIKKSNEVSESKTDKEVRPVSAKDQKDKSKTSVKGKPRSGKFWKSERERFSSVNKTKGLKQDFQKKTALRVELKRTKELAKQAMEELKQKQLERKERRRENMKRAEENKRKSEVVQVITNTAKLKRMRKKQLRFIQKSDTNKPVGSS